MDTKSKWTQNTKKWMRWGGTLLSGLLFLWIIRKQDWDLIIQSANQLSIILLLVVFFLNIGKLVINALRWYYLLQIVEIRLPLKQAIKIVFSGAFVSNFLPSTIGGDSFRFIGLLQFTTNRAKGGASVILDRLINMAAMLSLFPISVMVFSDSIDKMIHTGTFAWSIFPFLGMETRWVKSNQFISKARNIAKKGLNAFRAWFQRPYTLLLAFGISWLAILVYFLGVWLIAQDLGIEVKFYQVMGITVITYAITLLPISVNGFGVREIAVTTLYVQIGATLEQASTLAIITRFITLLATLPGAVWLSQIKLPRKHVVILLDESLNDSD